MDAALLPLTASTLYLVATPRFRRDLAPHTDLLQLGEEERGWGLSEWRGSVSLLGWAVRPEDVFVPAELRVEGEETVVVPAGRFDCWRLSIGFAGRKIDYWVRKTDGVAVRLRDDSQIAKRGSREIVLVRAP